MRTKAAGKRLKDHIPSIAHGLSLGRAGRGYPTRVESIF
jgi:hypothetical protein